MWQNFLYVAMDIGEFNQAMYAMKQIQELQEKEVDYEVCLCSSLCLLLIDIMDVVSCSFGRC
jgi:hypothetical protein